MFEKTFKSESVPDMTPEPRPGYESQLYNPFYPPTMTKKSRFSATEPIPRTIPTENPIMGTHPRLFNKDRVRGLYLYPRAFNHVISQSL